MTGGLSLPTLEAALEPEVIVVTRRKTAPSVVKGTIYTYTVLFEPAVEGGYTVTVPLLPGVITEGDTIREARTRVREAIAGYLKVLRKHGERVPVERTTRLGRAVTERVAVTL